MIKRCDFCPKIVYSEEEYQKHLIDRKYHPYPNNEIVKKLER